MEGCFWPKDLVFYIFDCVVKETKWQAEPFTKLCCVASWVRACLRKKYPFVLQLPPDFIIQEMQISMIDSCWDYMYAWLQQPIKTRQPFLLHFEGSRRRGFTTILALLTNSLENFDRLVYMPMLSLPKQRQSKLNDKVFRFTNSTEIIILDTWNMLSPKRLPFTLTNQFVITTQQGHFFDEDDLNSTLKIEKKNTVKIDLLFCVD